MPHASWNVFPSKGPSVNGQRVKGQLTNGQRVVGQCVIGERVVGQRGQVLTFRFILGRALDAVGSMREHVQAYFGNLGAALDTYPVRPVLDAI